jgi:hypothetical protein
MIISLDSEQIPSLLLIKYPIKQGFRAYEAKALQTEYRSKPWKLDILQSSFQAQDLHETMDVVRVWDLASIDIQPLKTL